MDISTESQQLIYKNLGLNLDEDVKTEEQVLEAVAERVRFLLDHDVGLLFSYMYRMDVLEVDINKALADKKISFPDKALAQLIINRQIQRIEMRKKYKVVPIEGYEW